MTEKTCEEYFDPKLYCPPSSNHDFDYIYYINVFSYTEEEYSGDDNDDSDNNCHSKYVIKTYNLNNPDKSNINKVLSEKRKRKSKTKNSKKKSINIIKKDKTIMNDSTENKYIKNKKTENIKNIITTKFKNIFHMKGLTTFLDTKFKFIPLPHQKIINYKRFSKLLDMTPREYIKEFMSNKNLEPFNLKEAEIVSNLFGTKTKTENEKSISDNFLSMDFILNNDNYEDNNCFSTNYLNSLFDNDKNNEISDLNKPMEEILEEEADKESLMNIVVNIDSRKDNLFERIKNMILAHFMESLNKKLGGKNVFSYKNNNFLSEIKNKERNTIFLKNSFKNNLSNFAKKPEKIIQTLKSIYEAKEKNNDAIKLLEQTPLEYINEIFSNEEKKKKFLEKDREMEKTRMENDKCRAIIAQLSETNNIEGLKHLKGLYKENGIEKYIKIIDASKFEKEAKKIKGYENFSINLSINEDKRIEERILILENLAENIMLYLLLIDERKPRNKKKKEKIQFEIKK